MKTFILGWVLATALVFGQTKGKGGDDTAAVQAVIDAFHAALRSGDAKGAMKLIADDAAFVEGGRIETRAQYEANHLPADIDFEKVIKSKIKTYKITVNGNTAWAILTSDMVGTFEGQPINMEGGTLAVFSKEASGWRIRSMHWSSHRR